MDMVKDNAGERQILSFFLSRATNPWNAQYEMCICVCAFESQQYPAVFSAYLTLLKEVMEWFFFCVNGEKRVCCLSGRSTSVIKWLASCQIPLSLIKSRIILLIEVVLEKANRESYCYIWSQKHTHIGQMLHQPSVTRKQENLKNFCPEGQINVREEQIVLITAICGHLQLPFVRSRHSGRTGEVNWLLGNLFLLWYVTWRMRTF